MTEGPNYGMLFAKSGIVYVLTGQKYAEYGLIACDLIKMKQASQHYHIIKNQDKVTEERRSNEKGCEVWRQLISQCKTV